MPHDTKTALIEQGLQEMMHLGYNHTGIQGVLAAVGVPKGSFYHYFRSKDDFGLQVIDRFVAENMALVSHYLGDESQPPLVRLQNYFEAYRDRYVSQGYSEGCLLGSIGLELADQNEQFTTKIEQVFQAWRGGFLQCLIAAQQHSDLDPQADVEGLAEFILNSWEGAILRMRVNKDSYPIQNFIDTLFGSVLPSAH